MAAQGVRGFAISDLQFAIREFRTLTSAFNFQLPTSSFQLPTSALSAYNPEKVLSSHIMTEANISILTCPECGNQTQEVMPTDMCIYFYECTGCDTLLRPLPGDCCVFCSYGTARCPPRLIEIGK